MIIPVGRRRTTHGFSRNESCGLLWIWLVDVVSKLFVVVWDSNVEYVERRFSVGSLHRFIHFWWWLEVPLACSFCCALSLTTSYHFRSPARTSYVGSATFATWATWLPYTFAPGNLMPKQSSWRQTSPTRPTERRLWLGQGQLLRTPEVAMYFYNLL